MGEESSKEIRSNAIKAAKPITDRIYCAYSSGTGVLFGIPSHDSWGTPMRGAVQTVVQCVLEEIDDLLGSLWGESWQETYAKMLAMLAETEMEG